MADYPTNERQRQQMAVWRLKALKDAVDSTVAAACGNPGEARVVTRLDQRRENLRRREAVAV